MSVKTHTEVMMEEGVNTILAAVRERGLSGDYRDLGDIRTGRLDHLLIFNYTAKAQYARPWNPVERASRGLIVDSRTATVAARPWEKFFGLDEVDETRLVNLPAGPCEITDKADGSLGILYRRADGYAVATRGSFTGTQAIWATAHLRERYNLQDLPGDLTLLFEIVYPGNRIVLDYGERQELVLIGARTFDGDDYAYDQLQAIADQYGFPLVPRYAAASIADLLPLVEATTGVEGWVVRYPNELRVKVKCSDYVRLHRVIFGLTAEHIRDALLHDWTTFLALIPPTLRPGIAARAQAMTHEVEREEARLRTIFDTLTANIDLSSRKAFAMHVVSQYPAERPYLFALLDGKPIRELLLKNLDLATFDHDGAALVDTQE